MLKRSDAMPSRRSSLMSIAEDALMSAALRHSSARSRSRPQDDAHYTVREERQE